LLVYIEPVKVIEKSGICVGLGDVLAGKHLKTVVHFQANLRSNPNFAQYKYK